MKNREEYLLSDDAARMRQELKRANDLDQQRAIHEGIRAAQTGGGTASKDTWRPIADRIRFNRHRIRFNRPAIAAAVAGLLVILAILLPQSLSDSVPRQTHLPEGPKMTGLEPFIELAGASKYKQSIVSAIQNGYYQSINEMSSWDGVSMTLNAVIAEDNLLFVLYTVEPPPGRAVYGVKQLQLKDAGSGRIVYTQSLFGDQDAETSIAEDVSRRKSVLDRNNFQTDSLLGRTVPDSGNRYDAIGVIRLDEDQTLPEDMEIWLELWLYDAAQIGSPKEEIKVWSTGYGTEQTLEPRFTEKSASGTVKINQDVELEGHKYNVKQVELSPLQMKVTVTPKENEQASIPAAPLLFTGSGDQTVMLRPVFRSSAAGIGGLQETFHFPSNMLGQPEHIQLLMLPDTSDENYTDYVTLDLVHRKVLQMPEVLKGRIQVSFQENGFELRQSRGTGNMYAVTDLHSSRLFFEQDGQEQIATYNVHQTRYDAGSGEWTEVYRNPLNAEEIRTLKIPIIKAQMVRVR